MNPTPFPNLDLPLVDVTTGRINKGWYQLLASMYLLLGGSDPVSPVDNANDLIMQPDQGALVAEFARVLESLRTRVSMDDNLHALVAETRKSLNDLILQQAIHTDQNARLAELDKRLRDTETALAFVGGATGNQPITLSGDVSGSGATTIQTVLANILTAGSGNNVTVDAKGRVTAVSSLPYGRTDQANTWSQTQTLSAGVKLGAGTTALSAYEEGTFTPAFNGSNTYTAQVGRYTRIGRMVHIQIHLNMSAKDASVPASAFLTISGLPYTSASVTGLFSSLAVGWSSNITLPASCTMLNAYVNTNDNKVWFDASGSGLAASDMTFAGLTNTSRIFLSGIYTI